MGYLYTPSVSLVGDQSINGTKTFAGVVVVNGSFAQSPTSAEIIAPVVHTTSGLLTSSANKMVNATSGNITLTLPVAASSQDARIVITKTDASANTVTVVPQAGGTIGGAVNYVLTAQYQSVTLVNGNRAVAGAWIVVGKT